MYDSKLGTSISSMIIDDENKSIFRGENIKSFTGQPVSSCVEGIKYFLK